MVWFCCPIDRGLRGQEPQETGERKPVGRSKPFGFYCGFIVPCFFLFFLVEFFDTVLPSVAIGLKKVIVSFGVAAI